MSKIVKNIIALSVSSALSISFIHNVNAATYQITDTGAASQLKYTYAQQQNVSGDIAITGTGVYNFPVQFKYLDSEDYLEILNYALVRYTSVHELNFIEDFDALTDPDKEPTANDLAWVVRWLQDTSSGKGLNIEYQKVGDSLALANVSGVPEEYTLWDKAFEGTDELTRSTIDVLSGITNGDILDKISYGTATAPYLPSDIFTNANDEEKTYWLRDHSLRGFYSFDQGAQVHQIVPIEITYGGGESSLSDVNESGIGVGYSSYKLTEAYKDLIENETGGCADPDVLINIPIDACIAQAKLQSSFLVYHNMAIKVTLDSNGNSVVEQLGLLVEPHEDDERAHSSYALAVNASGVAVGYAGGWDDETVITPSAAQSSNYQYAVVYKNGEVIDLTGDHSNKTNSRAYDINDAGIAVGHITKVISGKLVQKFFYVDTTVPKAQIEMVNPSDFFSDSDSTARAINNNGLIVGEGEFETQNKSTSNPRRTAAFVYDINTNLFSNLNDLIPCAARLTTNIIEARGINENGIISATAIVKANRFDAKGEAMLDEAGTPLTEDVVRAISLEPMTDDLEMCTAEEEGKVQRKGASFGIGSLIALISLLVFRRKLRQ